jgi:hypothetical protein
MFSELPYSLPALRPYLSLECKWEWINSWFLIDCGDILDLINIDSLLSIVFLDYEDWNY